MTAATLEAFSLYLWTRNRTLIAAAAVITAVQVAGAIVLPSGAVALLLTTQPVLSLAPLVLPLLLLPNILGADLASRESCFPKHLLALPLTARELVTPLMLFGLSFVAVLWLLVLRLPHAATHPWLPLLDLDIAAWAFAFGWLSFRRRWIRIALLIVLVLATALARVPDQSLLELLPGGVIAALALLQLPLAYALAVWGVTRARRGDPAPRIARARNAAAHAALEPFAAAANALAWLEWRTKALAWFPIATSVVFLLSMLSILFGPAPMALYAALSGDGASASGGPGAFIAPIWFPLTAGMICAAFPRPSADSLTMPSFLAVLPQSSGEFTWAKMRTALKIVPLYFVVTFVVPAVLAIAFGNPQSLAGVAAALQQDYGQRDANVLLAVTAVGFLAFTLGAALNVAWCALRGMRFAVWACTLAALALVAAAEWLAANPDRLSDALRALPGVLPAFAAAKLALLAWLAHRVGTRRLHSWTRIARIAGAWAAAVAVGVLGYYFAGSGADIAAVLSALILLLPIVAIVGAPLALERNRHR